MVNDFVMPLMLGLDPSSLTMSLVNIESPVHAEDDLADSIEDALRGLPHLTVERIATTVVASTRAGHDERVVVAGHLDTPAVDDPPPAYVEMGKLFGVGACDAKGGLAVMLKAAGAASYGRDVTFVFYGGKLDPSAPDGLAQLAAERPELVRADFALLMAPSGSAVRGGALEHPLAQSLIARTELPPAAFPGDPAAGVFDALGVPVTTFGPGDPDVAGTDAEYVPTAELSQCEFVLREWLRDCR